MIATIEPPVSPELLDAKSAAALLAISARHFIRLAESGKAPAPVKLGRSVRWRRAELLTWTQNGCPAVQGAER